ncbi:MAG: type II secretion system protein [Nodosilinea sp.]
MMTNRVQQHLNRLLSRGMAREATSQGLTLIECLVAIIMVALVASAITPALVISVATRVQSQKAEQALGLAQSEIDRVRLLVEQGGVANVSQLPPQAPTTLKDNEVAKQVGPLYGSVVAVPSTPTQTRPVDINDNGSNDFAVQTYRTRGLESGGVPVAFAMGVRVYDFDAVTSGGSGNLSTEPLSLATTAGEGQRSARPLAVLYTTIAVSEQGNSFCNLINYTASAAGSTASVPLGCN